MRRNDSINKIFAKYHFTQIQVERQRERVTLSLISTCNFYVLIFTISMRYKNSRRQQEGVVTGRKTVGGQERWTVTITQKLTKKIDDKSILRTTLNYN